MGRIMKSKGVRPPGTPMERSSKMVPQGPACPRWPKNKKKGVWCQEGIRNPVSTIPSTSSKLKADNEVAGWSKRRWKTDTHFRKPQTPKRR